MGMEERSGPPPSRALVPCWLAPRHSAPPPRVPPGVSVPLPRACAQAVSHYHSSTAQTHSVASRCSSCSIWGPGRRRGRGLGRFVHTLLEIPKVLHLALSLRPLLKGPKIIPCLWGCHLSPQPPGPWTWREASYLLVLEHEGAVLGTSWVQARPSHQGLFVFQDHQGGGV